MQIHVNGPLIVKAMLDHGYGMRDTVSRAHVDHKTLVKAIDGRMVRLDCLKRIMDVLELSAGELLFFDEQARQPRLRAVK